MKLGGEFIIIIGSLCAPVLTQDPAKCPPTILCNEDYCNDCYFNCLPPVPPEDSREYTLLKTFENVDDFCDCCQEKYVPYIEKGERCFQTISNYDLQSKGLCGAGLSCQTLPGQTSSTCERNPTNCHKAQDSYDAKVEAGELGMDESRPLCNDDGLFEPLQCYFAGVCRCVDELTGEPIFGLSVNLAVATQEGVNCGCGREMEVIKTMGCSLQVDYDGDTELSKAKFGAEYTECIQNQPQYFKDHLRCLPNGNYDPAQCIHQVLEGEDDSEYGDVCFCMDNDLNLNSSVVAIDVAHLVLPCHFEDALHVQNYYRPCEKARLEFMNEKRKNADYLYLSSEWLGVCSPDGLYALVQPDKTNPTLGYCSDSSGEQIEEFAGTYADMDCMCAQVRSAISATADRPECEENGSYRTYQCRAERCYCVDEYGRQISLEKNVIDFDPNECK